MYLSEEAEEEASPKSLGFRLNLYSAPTACYSMNQTLTYNAIQIPCLLFVCLPETFPHC